MISDEIVIVDCGIGNLGSIVNIIKKVNGPAPVVAADPEVVAQASKLILPGVGAFDHGIRKLRQRGLEPILQEMVLQHRVPILGICLGMQMMTQGSDEGAEPGLGWIDGRTVQFGSGDPGWTLRVPHMGWNSVSVCKTSPLFQDMYPEPRFYFVHSYHVVCEDPADVLATTFYGYEFVSAIQKGNIFGVQFHPEKSHKFGMKLIKNFLERI